MNDYTKGLMVGGGAVGAVAVLAFWIHYRGMQADMARLAASNPR